MRKISGLRKPEKSRGIVSITLKNRFTLFIQSGSVLHGANYFMLYTLYFMFIVEEFRKKCQGIYSGVISAGTDETVKILIAEDVTSTQQ